MSIIVSAILGSEKLVLVEERVIEIDLFPGAVIPKPDQEFESLGDLKAFMNGKFEKEPLFRKYL